MPYTRPRLMAALVSMILLLTCPPTWVRAADPDSTQGITRLELDVVEELNLARSKPALYASFIEELIPQFEGNLLRRPEGPRIRTKEGATAVAEAVAFLRQIEPIPTLTFSIGMSLGGEDHCRDQGPRGTTGHEGSDQSQVWDRVNRYGTWEQMIGECISYGADSAREVVMTLIIDDGVADRGHRKNIFEPKFRVAGVAYGHHAGFGSMCVIALAAGYVEGDRD